MRHQVVSWIIVVLLCTQQAWSKTTSQSGDPAVAFAISADDFAKLSHDEQRALIVGAMEYRLEHGRNLFYEAVRSLRLCDYTGDVLGEVQYQGITAVNRHWQLGSSYRLDTDTYGREGETAPRRYLVTGFDAEAGQSRSTRQTVGNKRSYGRIDVSHNAMTEHNRYAYWLDGKHTTFGDHLFRYLLDHQNQIVVDASSGDGLINVEVPWQPLFSEVPLGTRKVWLDPRKGFFPVRGYARWDRVRPNGAASWREEEFVVENSELVRDVWMPTKLKEVVGASTGPDPNTVAVYETEILAIQQGDVSPGDLVVPFKNGMEVVDAIQGVAYTVGADGEPVGPVEPLVGATPLTVAVPDLPGQPGGGRRWSPRFVLILVNIAIAVAVAGYFLLRRFAPGASSAGGRS